MDAEAAVESGELRLVPGVINSLIGCLILLPDIWL